MISSEEAKLIVPTKCVLLKLNLLFLTETKSLVCTQSFQLKLNLPFSLWETETMVAAEHGATKKSICFPPQNKVKPVLTGRYTIKLNVTDFLQEAETLVLTQ